MGLKSIWILGLQFLAHMFRRLFFLYRPGGTERLVENFRADHVFPLSEEDARLIPAFQRCTGCGLCDTTCPISGKMVGGTTFSLSLLAVAYWRDLTALQYSRDLAKALGACETCGACEAMCPERIPLRALGDFVASKRAK